MLRIDISKFLGRRWDHYHEDVPLILVKKFNIDTHKGMALALMTQPDVRGQVYLVREDAERYLKSIGVSSADAIQAFNKIKELKKVPGLERGKYCVQYPFVVDMVEMTKRIGAPGEDKTACVSRIKAWYMKNIIDVAVSEWTVGHTDPRKNLMTWQPPIQTKFRDSFKWCFDFIKMWPTPKELLPKFDTYYSEDEQMEIYLHLKKKFSAEQL